MYWNVGKYISEQVEQHHWGENVVEDLAIYIKENEPDIKGFNRSNLWRMKQFYEVYRENEKLASLRRELSWTHNHRIMTLKTAKEIE